MELKIKVEGEFSWEDKPKDELEELHRRALDEILKEAIKRITPLTRLHVIELIDIQRPTPKEEE